MVIYTQLHQLLVASTTATSFPPIHRCLQHSYEGPCPVLSSAILNGRAQTVSADQLKATAIETTQPSTPNLRTTTVCLLSSTKACVRGTGSRVSNESNAWCGTIDLAPHALEKPRLATTRSMDSNGQIKPVVRKFCQPKLSIAEHKWSMPTRQQDINKLDEALILHLKPERS